MQTISKTRRIIGWILSLLPVLAIMLSGAIPFQGIIIATLLYAGTMLRKPELSGLGI